MTDKAIDTLCRIAVGRHINGKAMGGEVARQTARQCLVELGVNWSESEAGRERIKRQREYKRAAE